MKSLRIFFLIAISFGVCSASKAQQLNSALSYESAIEANYGTASLEWVGQKGTNISFIFQEDLQKTYRFSGIILGQRIGLGDKWYTNPTIKAGFQQGRYLTFTPVLHLGYQVVRAFAIEGGVGWKWHYPTLSCGIHLTLFKS